MLRSMIVVATLALTSGCILVDEWDPYSGSVDSDGDGLSDRYEAEIGTRPHRVDSDWDGAWDGEEVFDLFTDPLDSDTDGDGLLDGEEAYEFFTDPLYPDAPLRP